MKISNAIPKTEFNKRLRQSRKDAGLIEVRVWVPKENRKELLSEFEKLINRKMRGI